MKLVPMDQAEFEKYLPKAMQEHRKNYIRAGYIEEDLCQIGIDQAYDNFPQGINTPNTYFLCLINENREKIGWLVFSYSTIGGKSAIFLSYMDIFEQYNNQINNQRLLTALEEKARELSAEQIFSHISGFNQIIKNSHENLGYEMIFINFRKEVKL